MTGLSVTEKILASHVTAGEMTPGRLLDVDVDQCLLQDVGGTMAMLELEALGIDSVLPRPSVVYVVTTSFRLTSGMPTTTGSSARLRPSSASSTLRPGTV